MRPGGTGRETCTGGREREIGEGRGGKEGPEAMASASLDPSVRPYLDLLPERVQTPRDARTGSRRLELDRRVGEALDKLETTAERAQFLRRLHTLHRMLYEPPHRQLPCSSRVPRGWECVELKKPMTFFKVTAVVGTELRSVFDARTGYQLGRNALSSRGACSWPPLEACFFAHLTEEGAVRCDFPSSSKARLKPRILLQVECAGPGYRRGDKFAFESCRVLQILRPEDAQRLVHSEPAAAA